uniref:HYC_CC_PP family protein n=1 Tax=Maribacter antarcticus TaxID=505250 RepID=UPI00047BB538|nr:hypothetical protein [Maribacter antarcticus]
MSLLMALLVLFSTMSFSLNIHYCGDHLVDYSLFDTADTCMMKAKMSKSSSECAVMDMEMNCCSDVEIVIEGLDDVKIAFDQFTFEQQVFITSFAISYINLFEGFDSNVIPFKDYSPPPLIRDIHILDQSFLI